VTAFAASSANTGPRLGAAAQPEPQAAARHAVLTDSQSAALAQRLGGEEPQQAAAAQEQQEARPQQILTNPQQVSDNRPAARPQKRGIFASLFAPRPQVAVGEERRPVAADTAAAAQTAFAAASAAGGLAAPSPAPR